MKIAYFSDFTPGQLSGVSDALRVLLPALRERGHGVRLYAPATPGGGDELIFAPGEHFPFVSIGVPWMPDYRVVLSRGVRADLEAFRPDLIHTQSIGLAGRTAQRMARRMDVPIVGTNHALQPEQYLQNLFLDFGWSRAAVRRLFARYFARCAHVTAPSQMVVDEMEEMRVGRPATVLSNPIDTDLFRPLPDRRALKAQWGLGDQVILSFGRLAKEKRLEDTLAAFAKVLSQEPGAELLVIGDGGERRAMEREAQRLGVASRTRFLGTLRGEELIGAINASDVFLITSPAESQSLTNLQAQACGIPVVGMSTGAVGEYIAEGVTGFKAAPGDADALAAHILTLLRDPLLRATFGAAGRGIALGFSPPKIAEKLEGVYEAVLKQNGVSISA